MIHGTVDADIKGNLTQTEISKTVEFCFRAFADVSFEEKEALVIKLKQLGLDGDANDEAHRQSFQELEKNLTAEELEILKTLKGRRMLRPEDSLHIDNFSLDSIDGMAPRLEHGKLGLNVVKRGEVKSTAFDSMTFFNGEARASGKMVQNDITSAHMPNGGAPNDTDSGCKTNGMSSKDDVPNGVTAHDVTTNGVALQEKRMADLST